MTESRKVCFLFSPQPGSSRFSCSETIFSYFFRTLEAIGTNSRGIAASRIGKNGSCGILMGGNVSFHFSSLTHSRKNGE